VRERGGGREDKKENQFPIRFDAEIIFGDRRMALPRIVVTRADALPARSRFASTCPREVFIAPDAAQSPLRAIARIVRRNEIADRARAHVVECAATFDQV